jgi:hypothetical protein
MPLGILDDHPDDRDIPDGMAVEYIVDGKAYVKPEGGNPSRIDGGGGSGYWTENGSGQLTPSDGQPLSIVYDSSTPMEFSGRAIDVSDPLDIPLDSNGDGNGEVSFDGDFNWDFGKNYHVSIDGTTPAMTSVDHSSDTGGDVVTVYVSNGPADGTVTVKVTRITELQ